MLDSKLYFYDGIADSFDSVANSCDHFAVTFANAVGLRSARSVIRSAR
jgi:hypothetical protein